MCCDATPGRETYWHVCAGRLDGVLDERSHGHLVAGDVPRLCVKARDLEKLVDEPPEPSDLGPEKIERLERPGRQFVASGLEDRERVGKGRERGTELVVDVGGEAGLPFDAFLKLVHHLVES